jgi:Domain of unknown function (DUF1083).
MTKAKILLALVLSSAGSTVGAQESRSTAAAQGERKRVEIVRTELSPKLDGILDDEIWKIAAVITDMHQFQPVDHGEPTERSEFYLAYDERFLYVAARLYDSDPSGISARQMVQGQGMPFDDAFEFILDTFNNGRTGYQFQANPNGIRREGVYENPSTLNSDWDGIWQVESRIDELGWTAEVAIPFNTLNFDPNTEEWGFTIARTIARKGEELAWSSFNRSINPSTTGILSGIRDIRQGKGLDVIPSITTAATKNYETGVTDHRVDPSLNVFYKITPNLTGALTLNTDFSATEVDNRQVNLSRFSLFFPEKRDFFLQDVDIFNFGGRGPGTNFDSNLNGIPFYSRRIGLGRNGQPIDLDVGVKLTGRVGPWNVGALAVQQGDIPGLEGQQVFVGRATMNVLNESSVGAIFTHGDPTSPIDSSLAGADFRYQNTRFSGNYTMRGNVFYQQSDTDGRTGDDKSYGAQITLETLGTGFAGTLGYDYFGEDFYPALGFANRLNVETYYGSARYRYFFKNQRFWRYVNFFNRFEQSRDLATGEMQSDNIFIRPINLHSYLDDQFNLTFGRNREGLVEDFEIRPGIVIPAGKYSFDNVSIEYMMSNQRLFAPGIMIRKGDFYEGKREQVRLNLAWRPNAHFYFNWNYDIQDIRLPEGEFMVKLVSMNANYAFNSKWSWVNLIQYDNASSSVGVNSRLRWNPRAGEDLYIVLNYNLDSEGVFSHISRERGELALKYTRTFRY